MCVCVRVCMCVLMFDRYHYALAGSAVNDNVNWHDWWLPTKNDAKAKFIVSPNCDICDESSTEQWRKTKTTYYMNGNFFGWFVCFFF